MDNVDALAAEVIKTIGPTVEALINASNEAEYSVVVLLTRYGVPSIAIVMNCDPDLGESICQEGIKHFPKIKVAHGGGGHGNA